MSLAAIGDGPNGSLVFGFETKGMIKMAQFDTATAKLSAVSTIAGSGPSKARFPALAVDGHGRTLMAWVRGAAWKKGGLLAWQLVGADNQPINTMSGGGQSVETWSFPAVVHETPNKFLVIY